jgi:F-type H+-transporting ATPase subunit gamma
MEPAASFIGFSDRPAFSDASAIAERVMSAYVDGDVDRIDVFYNAYHSPISQTVRRETLLPLAQATLLEETSEEEEPASQGHGQAPAGTRGSGGPPGPRASVEYEPDPEAVLRRLVPDYVKLSIYRALLESTASEHGARMTAMRNASQNAGELIKDLTLEMNRARQAEITQEIMEVVAGAEGLA